VLRQNPDADLPGYHADGEGENDRSLIISDTKTRPLKPGTDCQTEFRLIQLIALTIFLFSASVAVAQPPPPPVRVVPYLNPSSSLVLPGPA
jgi:hypothetical protein